MISEAWHAPPGTTLRPSEHPRRREVLIIKAEHIVHGQAVLQYEIQGEWGGRMGRRMGTPIKI